MGVWRRPRRVDGAVSINPSIFMFQLARLRTHCFYEAVGIEAGCRVGGKMNRRVIEEEKCCAPIAELAEVSCGFKLRRFVTVAVFAWRRSIPPRGFADLFLPPPIHIKVSSRTTCTPCALTILSAAFLSVR